MLLPLVLPPFPVKTQRLPSQQRTPLPLLLRPLPLPLLLLLLRLRPPLLRRILNHPPRWILPQPQRLPLLLQPI
ncbi:hypothetical protein CR983_02605 [Candidatus Saccharibacteria bacterium]|nr:MAG: hypothetical protein CR983_02605 [Candidatus Saccharibacteria bacterium]